LLLHDKGLKEIKSTGQVQIRELDSAVDKTGDVKGNGERVSTLQNNVGKCLIDVKSERKEVVAGTV
jgi:hypothetical protein